LWITAASLPQVPETKWLDRFLDAEDLVMGRCKDLGMEPKDWEKL
jgi:hypothetical protein